MSYRCILCDGDVSPEQAGVVGERGDFMLRGYCPHCEKRTALRITPDAVIIEDDDGEID